MKIELAENIRRFRKNRGITQEQLAEAMGVTVGAVSKWETGSSMPDIGLIIALAELFDTSVDVLLGYGLEQGSMKKALDELQTLFRQKRFDEAVLMAEKLLLKYPNSFEVVHKCAITYNMKGLEQRSNRELKRALELFERAIALVEQNTAERVNEWSLRNAMARVHLTMGNLEKGLEMLKSNNAEGVNDADIGCVLAREEDRQDEAADYLAGALMRNAMQLVNVVDDFGNIYAKRGELTKAAEAYRWVCGFLESLMLPGEVSYLDYVLIGSLSGLCVCLYRLGDIQQTKKYMALAKKRAMAFDMAPDYSFRAMRFYESEDTATGFTDFGTSAMEGISNCFFQQEDCGEKLLALWSETE